MTRANDSTSYNRLLELLAEIDDLEKTRAVLNWDRHTQMPPGGHRARADHTATLERIIHGRLVSPEIGELLSDLSEYEESRPYGSDEAGIIRITRRRRDRAVRTPPELVSRLARARSEAYASWLEARQRRDFRVFLPALEGMVDLMRWQADALGYEDTPLDVLIDLREPGLTAAKLDRLFSDLRDVLVPLAAAIAASGGPDRAAPLVGSFERGAQIGLGKAAVRAIGFDLDRRGRMDLSVHPFSTTFSSDDVRITTRIKEEDFRVCFFALLHEAGHGTYMQGVPERHRRTPLHDGASAGMHESQSRLWENIVGRSRAFWEYFLPVARAYFPAQFGSLSPDEMYAASSAVAPSLIRVEADEVTYNLHIMIRFELEREVFSGALRPADLAEAWNERTSSYLGLTPPDDLTGVLQDIHWTMGFGGSFGGYTLGNVISAALYRRALADHPAMEDDWRRGDFSALLTWMNENVHAHGARFTPEELLERVTGEGLTAGPYLDYIRGKYGDLYGV